jgi:hypothetical protein
MSASPPRSWPEEDSRSISRGQVVKQLMEGSTVLSLFVSTLPTGPAWLRSLLLMWPALLPQSCDEPTRSQAQMNLALCHKNAKRGAL